MTMIVLFNRYLACILLPSFLVELTHKIMFFLKVTVYVPYITSEIIAKIILGVLVLWSWVYRTGVFLLVCILFRLTCELQILRFEGFRKLLEGCGSDISVIFKEHVRIRTQLSGTSHRYRCFIIGCLVTITVSQFGALLLVLASKETKTFLNSGDLIVSLASWSYWHKPRSHIFLWFNYVSNKFASRGSPTQDSYLSHALMCRYAQQFSSAASACVLWGLPRSHIGLRG